MATSIEQAFRPGQGVATIGEYELLALIARGSAATVYLCRRSGDGGFARLFALKALPGRLLDDADRVRAFLDEARIGARLHHPNVTGAVELGAFRGAPFIVMDHVEGCSLADLQARLRGELPVAAALHIAVDALEGLQAAHSLIGDDGEALGLVHRDISPRNVLVGVDGTARIAELGAARIDQAGAPVRSREREGELAFMAPEQILGDEVDRRADLFSMGVVLWNALTGRSLFGRRSQALSTRELLAMPVPRPSSVSGRCPAWLDEVCTRALQRDPDRRYQTASEMSAAIREVAAAEGAAGSPREVGQLVQRAFAEELRWRRVMLGSAVTGADAPASGASLPAFAPLVSESEWTPRPLGEGRRDGRRRPLLLWLAAAGLVAAVSASALVGTRLLGGDDAVAADRGAEASARAEAVPAAASDPPRDR